jgi:hypothetical protein
MHANSSWMYAVQIACTSIKLASMLSENVRMRIEIACMQFQYACMLIEITCMLHEFASMLDLQFMYTN